MHLGDVFVKIVQFYNARISRSRPNYDSIGTIKAALSDFMMREGWYIPVPDRMQARGLTITVSPAPNLAVREVQLHFMAPTRHELELWAVTEDEQGLQTPTPLALLDTASGALIVNENQEAMQITFTIIENDERQPVLAPEEDQEEDNGQSDSQSASIDDQPVPF